MKDYDVFRDSNLRYLGYANEVGEAFRPLIKRSVVNASYALATGYVCADVIDKCIKEHRKGSNATRVGIVAGDVFIWQMVASVIVPGLTINRITWLAGRLLRKGKARQALVKTIPTVVGLCSIPIIISPIDRLTDCLMDITYRRWLT